MKNKIDEAISISNPRLLSACYFSLLSIIIIFFLDAIFSLKLYLIPTLPTSHSLLLGATVTAICGALFGERIVHAQQPYLLKTFWWGFLLMIVALPLYELGVIVITHTIDHSFLQYATFAVIFKTFGIILFYSYLFFGIWFAILSGFAAMYLRGILVYYCLRSLDD